jgi:hypothetical protein
MNERFDDLARQFGENTPRRAALMGLGAMALGSLGLTGFGQDAEAKNKCNKCKHKCKKKNRKKNNNNNKQNCNHKCRNKCKNN